MLIKVLNSLTSEEDYKGSDDTCVSNYVIRRIKGVSSGLFPGELENIKFQLDALILSHALLMDSLVEKGIISLSELPGLVSDCGVYIEKQD